MLRGGAAVKNLQVLQKQQLRKRLLPVTCVSNASQRESTIQRLQQEVYFSTSPSAVAEESHDHSSNHNLRHPPHDPAQVKAVRNLRDSLLRSQHLLPPVADLEDQRNRVNDNELRLWLELQRWLRFFATHGSELPATELADNEEEISDKESASDESSATLEEKAGQQNISVEPKTQSATEYKKNVPAFFDRTPRLYRDLQAAIQQNNVPAAMHLYRSALRDGREPQLPLLNALFTLLVSQQQPFDAHVVLKHYQRLDNNSLNASFYERLCDCMRHMDPLKHSYNDIHDLTRDVVKHVQRLDSEGQSRCIPVLVSALAMQRAVRVGHFAKRLYYHMMEHGFSVTEGYWEHLLSMSKYNRQKDLPFAEIMQRSVEVGWRSNPATILHALENMYPFRKTEDVCIALRAIATLQTQQSDDSYEYIVDLGTLDSLSSMSAQTGNIDLNMLVWELVDIYGYQPTMSLYENTICCFASRRETYPNAFSVMAEMEANGMTISRGLIRSVSSQWRVSLNNLDLALGHFQRLYQDGAAVSTGQLNCILSAAAERGDLNSMSFIVEEFSNLGLEMNADSYSFALEALGKHLSRSRKVDDPDESVVRDCLEKSSGLLSAMEESGVLPSPHIIREYVELLCQADEVETATEVVLDVLNDGGEVNNKTIYKVAMACADAHNFAAARSLANHLCDSLPALLGNIDRKEEEAMGKGEFH